MEIHKNAALFLDRDGVINKLLEGKYVKSWEQWQFIDGSLQAIVKLSKLFKYVFVVTNQQGIGKKLMTEEDLLSIHKNLESSVLKEGGKIDKIYFSPYLNSWNHNFRKPNTGMGYAAKKDFPDFDFEKSFMVGDYKTDMLFGKKLNMTTIYVGKDDQEAKFDYRFKNLEAFYLKLIEEN